MIEEKASIGKLSEKRRLNNISNFSMLDLNNGWISENNFELNQFRLYITDDGGENWLDVTPSKGKFKSITDLGFIDSDRLAYLNPQT